MGSKLWDRFNAGPEEQLWFYQQCLRALREGTPSSIVYELKEVVEELETRYQDSINSEKKGTTNRDDIWAIVTAKYDEYVDRIVQQIRALPADSRQSGDDSVLADVWEEFKYQIQRQESCLMEAYEERMSTLCRQLVERLPQHELGLLWLWSDGYYNWHEDEEPPAKEEDVVTELYVRVCSRASDEELIQDPDAKGSLFEENE